MTPATDHPAAPGARQSGVGLIEILIAVLVLSIGLLGMAALQSKALSNNNSAMTRSMATIASYSILDGMRIDQAGVTAGNYDGAEVTVTAVDHDGDATCTGVDGGGLTVVNLGNWCDELGRLVGPGTIGRVTHEGGGNYVIEVEFDDSRGTGGVEDQVITTQAKL